MPPEETEPPSCVETAPAPQGGARGVNAFPETQDMEESTDTAPLAVVANQLEAFRREIEAMRQQIRDQYITLEEVRKAKKVESKPSAPEKKKAPEAKNVDYEPTGERFCRKFEKYTPLKQ
ncbi:hypothetical protein ACS0TY_030542 [Phlomoides rotata]